MGVGGQCHAQATLPPQKTQYPLYRRLGGPHGQSGQKKKISSPPGFNPQTVQPIASRYIDWAILPSSDYTEHNMHHMSISKARGIRDQNETSRV